MLDPVECWCVAHDGLAYFSVKYRLKLKIKVMTICNNYHESNMKIYGFIYACNSVWII